MINDMSWAITMGSKTIFADSLAYQNGVCSNKGATSVIETGTQLDLLQLGVWRALYRCAYHALVVLGSLSNPQYGCSFHCVGVQEY